MGEGIEGLLNLIGKGIIGLTTGQNATGSDEEQKMVQGVLGSVVNKKSTSQEEYEYYKNTGGGGSFSEFLNQTKVPAKPIPSAINVMRRPQEEQSNLGLGGMPTLGRAAEPLSNQMLQYGAGGFNPYQRDPLASLQLPEQKRKEVASLLPQMSIAQQDAFIRGMQDGKVSEYELENQKRLRQGY